MKRPNIVFQFPFAKTATTMQKYCYLPINYYNPKVRFHTQIGRITQPYNREITGLIQMHIRYLQF